MEYTPKQSHQNEDIQEVFTTHVINALLNRAFLPVINFHSSPEPVARKTSPISDDLIQSLVNDDADILTN